MSRDGNVEVVAPHSHPLDPEGVSADWVGVGAPDASRAPAELFRLLGDPARARMTLALGAGGRAVRGRHRPGDRDERNPVSYALRHLRAAGLVHRRREGRVISYRLADSRIHDVMARVQTIAGG